MDGCRGSGGGARHIHQIDVQRAACDQTLATWQEITAQHRYRVHALHTRRMVGARGVRKRVERRCACVFERCSSARCRPAHTANVSTTRRIPIPHRHNHACKQTQPRRGTHRPMMFSNTDDLPDDCTPSATIAGGRSFQSPLTASTSPKEESTGMRPSIPAQRVRSTRGYTAACVQPCKLHSRRIKNNAQQLFICSTRSAGVHGVPET